MRLDILEAKNRRSERVHAACTGTEVVIAKNWRPMVRLVPVAAAGRLKGYGSLEATRRSRDEIDEAFTAADEAWRDHELDLAAV